MKKLILAALITCTVLSFTACGKTAEKSKTDDNVNLANTDVTTADTQATDEVPDADVQSLPDKSTLEKIPDEAVASFDYVVDACKKLYPQADKSKRLYGYTGLKTVNDNECYGFVVYDKADDVTIKVATLAIETKSDKLYKIDDETGSAEVVEVPDDSEASATESCSDTVTASFADYYKAKSSSISSVLETAAVKTIR